MHLQFIHSLICQFFKQYVYIIFYVYLLSEGTLSQFPCNLSRQTSSLIFCITHAHFFAYFIERKDAYYVISCIIIKYAEVFNSFLKLCVVPGPNCRPSVRIPLYRLRSRGENLRYEQAITTQAFTSHSCMAMYTSLSI